MSNPKITGLGGVFFKAQAPEKLKQWYARNLGLVLNNYGATFEMRNAQNPSKIKYLHWSVFPSDTDYFHPSDKPFMLNYRVRNLEQLVVRLQRIGVDFSDTMASYPYGKFIHLLDPEGNAIELWEPREDFFDSMKIPTNK